MASFIQITITVGTRKEGEQLVHTLLENRLIACGQNLGPIQNFLTTRT